MEPRRFQQHRSVHDNTRGRHCHPEKTSTITISTCSGRTSAMPGDTCRFGRKFSGPASKSPLSAMLTPFLLHRSQIQSNNTILRRGAMERAVLRKCTRWRQSATVGQRYLARRRCARLPVYRLSTDKDSIQFQPPRRAASTWRTTRRRSAHHKVLVALFLLAASRFDGFCRAAHAGRPQPQ